MFNSHSAGSYNKYSIQIYMIHQDSTGQMGISDETNYRLLTQWKCLHYNSCCCSTIIIIRVQFERPLKTNWFSSYKFTTMTFLLEMSQSLFRMGVEETGSCQHCGETETTRA